MTGKRPLLSVCIITYNEEKRIEKAIKSVIDIADEVIVVDAESEDNTREIAQSLGARVIVRSWTNYMDQKNFALAQASGKWVLFIDADEIVTDELRKNIQKAISSDTDLSGYKIFRRPFYRGKKLRFAWGGGEKILRLVRHDAAPEWTGGPVHEKLTVKGKIGALEGELLHHTADTVMEHVSKSIRYAKLSAEKLHSHGVRFRLLNLIFNPIVAFLKEFFVHLAFLDGIRGLAVTAVYTFYVFLKYLFLWELEIQNRGRNEKG